MAEITSSRSQLRVGVDSGGTFTDVSLLDEGTGEVRVWKVSSTPEDPSRAIVEGVAEGLADYARARGAIGTVIYFGHGTTVATNALIEGRGSVTGMITTSGFRDIIELRRQKRDSLYDLQVDKPAELVTRDKRLEVAERVAFDGKVLIPLDANEVRGAARRLREQGVNSVAVCFLFSFLAPEHEQMVKAIISDELPDAFVSISSEVAPEFREYERFSTTVVNAYVGPVMKGYLERLSPRLREVGIDVPVHLTQSNGGIITAETARDFPARTILSGPAAGVASALAIGRQAGFDDIITFDMGGTSTDVSLIEAGRAAMSKDTYVNGYPIKLPMLDIQAVGAGGGSVAYVDAGGLLKVGPMSAAASPGPACYGRGGIEATVTDANVVLQTLSPTKLLDGRMTIQRDKAVAAVSRLADKLGLDVMETAQGIISVVVANMAKAVRVISVERGHDPRDHVLLAFGGAGPLHAARLARSLEMPRVVVPRYPGVLCSLGLLLADLRSSLSQTRMMPLSGQSMPALRTGLAELAHQANQWCDREGIAVTDREIMPSLDMRYAGQAHELTIPITFQLDREEAISTLRAEFERAHTKAYGYASENEQIQIVTLRTDAVGRVHKARLPTASPAIRPVADAVIEQREVWLPEAGGFASCAIYDREKLAPSHRIEGPAIVQQMDATTLVLPGQIATTDPYLNIIIEG